LLGVFKEFIQFLEVINGIFSNFLWFFYGFFIFLWIFYFFMVFLFFYGFFMVF